MLQRRTVPLSPMTRTLSFVLPPVHRVIDVQHGHLAVVLQEVAPHELERLLVCGNHQAAKLELQRVSLLICVGLVHEVLKLETCRPEPVLEALEPLERGQPLAGVRLATQPLLLGLFVLPRGRLELRRLARPQLSLVLWKRSYVVRSFCALAQKAKEYSGWDAR